MKTKERAMRAELEQARAEWDSVRRTNAARREEIAAELPRAAKSDPPPAAVTTPLAWWLEQLPVG